MSTAEYALACLVLGEGIVILVLRRRLRRVTAQRNLALRFADRPETAGRTVGFRRRRDEPQLDRQVDPDARDLAVGPDRQPARVDGVAWLRARQGWRGDFPLFDVENFIGRSDDAAVPIPDRTISRRHCAILRGADGWRLRQLGPNGGTVLNGRDLADHAELPLRDGDLIAVGTAGAQGRVEFVFLAPDVHAEAVEWEFIVAGRTAAGSREHNEDRFLMGPRLLVAADGVSGRPAGQEAADLAVQTVESLLAADPGMALTSVVQTTNTRIREHGAGDPLAEGLATTLDVVVPRGRGTAGWLDGVHVGDGLVMVMEDGVVDLLTRRHRLGDQLLADGRLSPEQVRLYPARSALSRAVGFTAALEPDHWRRRARAGQRVFVLTDGVAGAVRLDDLVDAARATAGEEPQQAAETLLALASRAHSDTDNLTAVVADVVPAHREPARPDPIDEPATRRLARIRSPLAGRLRRASGFPG